MQRPCWEWVSDQAVNSGGARASSAAASEKEQIQGSSLVRLQIRSKLFEIGQRPTPPLQRPRPRGQSTMHPAPAVPRPVMLLVPDGRRPALVTVTASGAAAGALGLGRCPAGLRRLHFEDTLEGPDQICLIAQINHRSPCCASTREGDLSSAGVNVLKSAS